jgi:hypothetical protein
MPRHKFKKPLPTLTTDDEGHEVVDYGIKEPVPNQVLMQETPSKIIPALSIRPYLAAALTGILARPGTSHPTQLTRSEMRCLLKSAADIAEVALEEEKARYG